QPVASSCAAFVASSALANSPDRIAVRHTSGPAIPVEPSARDPFRLGGWASTSSTRRSKAGSTLSRHCRPRPHARRGRGNVKRTDHLYADCVGYCVEVLLRHVISFL